MLNFEQILIKAAQFLEFDLKRLQIDQTTQQRRIFTRENGKEKYDEVITNLLEELFDVDINDELEDLLAEFIEYYSYIQKEIYITYSQKFEKQFDWLILKYFIVPFFAVRMSELFASYENRIDNGLPGGEFWYLPKHDGNKIVFPANFIMNWWIDLYGTSKEDFYYDKNATPHDNFDEAGESENEAAALEKRHSLLKSWHYKPDIPSKSSIEKYTSTRLNYRGVFNFNPDGDKEEQFNDAYKFIKNVKKLTIEELKREFPNRDNLLDRLGTELTSNEKERFVVYVKDRWKVPTSKYLKSLLTVAKVSQNTFKKLSEYFDSNQLSTEITENKILQLTLLFSELYNFNTAVIHRTPLEERFELYHDYLIKFLNHDIPNKERLDIIIAQIEKEVSSDNFDFGIDEIIAITSTDDLKREDAIRRLNEKASHARERILSEKKLYMILHEIMHSTSVSEIRQAIDQLDNFHSAFNIGQFCEGNNFLTNDEPVYLPDIGLEVYGRCFEIASSPAEKSISAQAIINLATNPFMPRLLTEEEVEYWFQQRNASESVLTIREELIVLATKTHHELLQKNYQQCIILIEEYMEKIKKIKQEEYEPQFLCIAQIVAKLGDNRKLEKKLNKLNRHHPEYPGIKSLYALTGFYYY